MATNSLWIVSKFWIFNLNLQLCSKNGSNSHFRKDPKLAIHRHRIRYLLQNEKLEEYDFPFQNETFKVGSVAGYNGDTSGVFLSLHYGGNSNLIELSMKGLKKYRLFKPRYFIRYI